MENLPLNTEPKEPGIVSAADAGQSEPQAPLCSGPDTRAVSLLGVGSPQMINGVLPHHPADLHLTAPAQEEEHGPNSLLAPVPASAVLCQQLTTQDSRQAVNDDPQDADAAPGGPPAMPKAEPLENGAAQKGGGSPRGAARRRKPQRTRMRPADVREIDQPVQEAAEEGTAGAPTLWESDPEISGAEIFGESDGDREGDCEPSSTSHADASRRGGGRWNSRRRPKSTAAAGRSSRFRGVYWEPKGSKWYSSISYNHKQIHLGSFATEEEAARAFDAEAVRLRGPNTYTNFPLPSESLEGRAPMEAPALTSRRPRRAKKKESHVVSEDEEGAAKPLAGAAKALVLLASVPSEDAAPKSSRRRPARTSAFREDSPQAVLRGQKRKRGGGALSTSPRVDGTGRARSKYTGVYQQSRGNGWFASICVDKTMRYLGTFATEDEAARAFDQEAIRLRGPEIELNLPHEAYLHSPHVFPAPKRSPSSEPAKAAAQVSKRGPTRMAHQVGQQDASGSDGGATRGRRVTAGGNGNETGGLLDGSPKPMPRRKRRSALQESALAEQDSEEAAESEALAWGRKRRRNQAPPDVPTQGHNASLDTPACKSQAAGQPAAGKQEVVFAPQGRSSLQQDLPPQPAAPSEPTKDSNNSRLPAPCTDTATAGTFLPSSQSAEGIRRLQAPQTITAAGGPLLRPNNGQPGTPDVEGPPYGMAVGSASYPSASSVSLAGEQPAANGYSSGLWMGVQQPSGSAVAVGDVRLGL